MPSPIFAHHLETGLEQLQGDRLGQYSIRVNDRWRLCFLWENGEATEVEFCDYH